MRRNVTAEHLASVPMFTACTKRELAQLARQGEEYSVEKGAVLVKEGSLGHEFYVLLEGKAEVLRDGSVIATLGVGDFFGELALLEPAPRNATVRMATDGEVLELGRTAFFQILEDVPVLTRRVLIGMARRLHAIESRPAS